MLTKSQQHQVIDHLDKARLTLQAASKDFEYKLVQNLITRIMHTIEKYKVKDER
jgi:hypothetical protein